MYSFKKNNNNDGEPLPDICRLRSRPSFLISSVTILAVTISCLLTLKPYDAAAVNPSTDNHELPTYQIEQSLNQETFSAATEMAYHWQASMAQAFATQINTTPDNTAQDDTQTGASQASTPPDNTVPADAEETATTDTLPVDPEPFVYNSNIPLDCDIQQYLYDLCTQRNLDYKMCLAIIKHESSFNAKALGGGSNYGLFQINKCNHKKLSSTLKTANKPLDPKININWGTYLLSCLFEKYSTSYTDEELLKAVLSAYNRGEGGFAKYGFAKSYIEGHFKALDVVNSWFI